MAIALICPGCGTPLTLDDRRAGRTVTCRCCHTAISVPRSHAQRTPAAPPAPAAPDEDPDTAAPIAPAPAPPPPPRRSKRVRSRWRCHACDRVLYEDELDDVEWRSIPVATGHSEDAKGEIVTHYRYVSRPVCERCRPEEDEMSAPVGCLVALCVATIAVILLVCGGLASRAERGPRRADQSAPPAKARAAEPGKPNPISFDKTR